ncbi:tyrosine-type recombinase/integrase [Ktedonobacteria bacterium brp13]|nr:tyrosine-type recombinase/integrase [Ktedonobacteria bacterium brp13]
METALTRNDAHTTTAITAYEAPRCQDGSPIEALILNFVKDKAAKSQSQKTAKAYFDTVTSFRSYLQERGYDLIMYSRDEEGWTEYTFIRSKLADCASDFAIKSKKPGKTLVAEATRDQRLAILSSFYQYADLRRKVPFSNPITMIERSPVQAYAGAVALSEEQVQQALAKIDRSTLLGQRNYTLLLILLNTGGRVGQIQKLTRGALYLSPSRVVTVVFRHMKGNKASEQVLDPRVSAVLLTYLETLYDQPVERIDAAAPLWTVLTDIPSPLRKDGVPLYQKGDPLKYGAIRYLCQQLLGTGKVHTTRHTFSLAMLESGATTDDLQEQLNHSDPKTTRTYARHFQRQKNKHAAAVATRFGL